MDILAMCLEIVSNDCVRVQVRVSMEMWSYI